MTSACNTKIQTEPAQHVLCRAGSPHPTVDDPIQTEGWKTGKIADALADNFKVHDEQDDMDELYIGDAAVALSTTISSYAMCPVYYHPVKVSIVLEGNVVVNLSRLVHAFLVMFGLIYALHHTYPKELPNTFEFTQKILLGLDDFKLSPRLQSLKNDLMIHV